MKELFPGYTVEAFDPSTKEGKLAAYKVTGPKMTWFLVRNVHKPHMLFPLPETATRPMKIKGHEWFTDKDGELRPC